MLGFPTYEEARHAQKICLNAPMDEVVRFFESLRPGVKSGRVRVINPEHPSPETASQARWIDARDDETAAEWAAIIEKQDTTEQ
jgi:hypothetical protein